MVFFPTWVNHEQKNHGSGSRPVSTLEIPQQDSPSTTSRHLSLLLTMKVSLQQMLKKLCLFIFYNLLHLHEI